MKHLKLFNNETDYNTWLNSNNFVTPYIVKDKSNNNVIYQKKLPYDYKIEYLETTGTQWIDTGIQQKSTHGFKTKLLLNTYSVNPAFPTVVQKQDYQSNFGIIVGHINEGRKILIGNNSWSNTEIITELNKTYDIEYNYKNNSKTVINQQIFDIPINKVNNLNNICLCCIITEGINQTHLIGPLVIYNFQLTDGDDIVLDLIPVVKDNIGYMYDKISSKLFGNQGTGEFILGPNI